MDERLKLRRMPLLLTVDDMDRYLAERSIYFQRYNKGVTVHSHSESCNSLDVVISGKLIAYSLAENGSMTTIFEFSPGQYSRSKLAFCREEYVSAQHLLPFGL